MTDRKHILIGLTGVSGRVARAGKDTFANMLAASLEERGETAFIRSFAFPLWHAVAELTGKTLNDVLTHKDKHLGGLFEATPRDYANAVGDACRKVEVDFFINRHHDALCLYASRWIIVPDVRQANEAAYVRRNGRMVFIDRPNAERVTAHHTNNGLEYDYMADYALRNVGTLADLKVRADSLAASLINNYGPRGQKC